MIWRDGLLDDIVSDLTWPVLDAGFDADGGWALVMEDVTDHLVSAGGPFGCDEFSSVMAAVAPLHRRHLATERPSYVMTMSDRIRLFSPALVENERAGTDTGPRQIAIGWERLLASLPDELAMAVEAVHRDPEPLGCALLPCGATLLHGDVNPRNIALRPGRVDLFDWGLATWGPPDVDAGWFIAMAPLGGLCGREDELFDRWRRIQGDHFDQHTLDVSVIATFCTYGFGWGWFALTVRSAPMTGAMQWWIHRFATALETWSPT